MRGAVSSVLGGLLVLFAIGSVGPSTVIAEEDYETGTPATRRYPGVNVNHLHSDRVRDRFSGMPVFNGTPCSVAAVPGDGPTLAAD